MHMPREIYPGVGGILTFNQFCPNTPRRAGRGVRLGVLVPFTATPMTTLGRTGGMFLIISMICCIFSNSWLITWITLEINTMSFCAVILYTLDKETSHKESIIKYFMVQSIASALLLLRCSYEVEKRAFMLIWLVLAIITKMGRVPFHQ